MTEGGSGGGRGVDVEGGSGRSKCESGSERKDMDSRVVVGEVVGEH